MNILEAIANELNQIFDQPKIYFENQKQGFDAPCFYIFEVRSQSGDELSKYEMRQHTFNLLWFPDENKVSDEGYEIGEREQCSEKREELLNKFRFLSNGNRHLLKREIQITDGVLNMTFNVRYRVKAQTDDANMQTLEQMRRLSHDEEKRG